MERYEWRPTESAFQEYPMQLVKGDLHLADGSSIYIPSKSLIKNGWGNVGSVHIVGPDAKAVPKTLEISWFSFTEDRFYAGTFPLPSEKIAALMTQGAVDQVTQTRSTYDYVIVGLAPEGGVTLWLAGGGQVTTVAHFRAEAVALDWQSFIKNTRVSRADYVEKMLRYALTDNGYARLKQTGIAPDLWLTYQKKYRWKERVSGTAHNSWWLTTFNGDIQHLNSDATDDEWRAVPKSIRLKWTSPSGGSYTADITFDANELFAVFDQCTNQHPDSAIELMINIVDDFPTLETQIHCAGRANALKRSGVEIFKG